MSEKNEKPVEEVQVSNGKIKGVLKGRKVRIMTFIYMSENSTEIELGNHRTKAFSINAAWKEFIVKHKLAETTKRFGTALTGQAEWMPEQIRVPTSEEMKVLLKENNLL